MADLSHEGTIRDIHSGRVVGKTASMLATFVEQAARDHDRGPAYVVCDTGHHGDELVAALEAADVGIPVVRDGKMKPGVAYIMAGTPSEWQS